ncbi:hypothetical protein HPP92_019400 [Vanilla planifolia]|uniref:Uncharacterized protein n=1 Tax=Vanilla planifolia TaxID=51239 RepID=A0A835UL34_VANPL|nr:hypothetical protein HPP92_019400 [Vanilla planifolia]
MEYGTWSEIVIKSNNNLFSRCHNRDLKIGPWTRKDPTGNSRAEVIASCRKEMMEFVRNMSREADDKEKETMYELSLKDIVQTQKEKKTEEEKTEVVLSEKGSFREDLGTKSKEQTEELIANKSFLARVPAMFGGRWRLSSGRAGGKGTKEGCSSRNPNSRTASGSRIKGRISSCYQFLRPERSRSMEM